MTTSLFISRLHDLCQKPGGRWAWFKATGANPAKIRDLESLEEFAGAIVLGASTPSQKDWENLIQAEQSLWE